MSGEQYYFLLSFFSPQTLAGLLFAAAKDGGYFDLHCIENILGVPLSSLNTVPLQKSNTVSRKPQGKYVINP